MGGDYTELVIYFDYVKQIDIQVEIIENFTEKDIICHKINIYKII